MPGILIADNEVPFVYKMVRFLTEKGYALAGLADTPDKAITMSRRLKPDLVLMETELSEDMDGISAANTIRSRQDIPIVFVTSHVHGECLQLAKRVHPAGYVLKPFNESQVQAAIEMALEAGQGPDPSYEDDPLPAEAGAEHSADDRALRKRFLTLTTAELKVANLIRKGNRTREIAKKLKVRPSTVDWHRKNIRKKLGLTGSKTGLMGKLLFLM